MPTDQPAESVEVVAKRLLEYVANIRETSILLQYKEFDLAQNLVDAEIVSTALLAALAEIEEWREARNHVGETYSDCRRELGAALARETALIEALRKNDRFESAHGVGLAVLQSSRVSAWGHGAFEEVRTAVADMADAHDERKQATNG